MANAENGCIPIPVNTTVAVPVLPLDLKFDLYKTIGQLSEIQLELRGSGAPSAAVQINWGYVGLILGWRSEEEPALEQMTER